MKRSQHNRLWGNAQSRPALLALGGMLALAVFIVGSAVTYGVTKYQWASSALSSLEPRYARLLGLEKSQAELEQKFATIQAQLAQCCYPADRDATQAGNDAQQRLRGIFTAAGVQVVSTQVMPAKEEGSFDRIPIAVRLEGELVSVQSALAGLQRQSPEFWVDALAIQTIGSVLATQPQRLGVQLTVSLLRRRT